MSYFLLHNMKHISSLSFFMWAAFKLKPSRCHPAALRWILVLFHFSLLLLHKCKKIYYILLIFPSVICQFPCSFQRILKPDTRDFLERRSWLEMIAVSSLQAASSYCCWSAVKTTTGQVTRAWIFAAVMKLALAVSAEQVERVCSHIKSWFIIVSQHRRI